MPSDSTTAHPLESRRHGGTGCACGSGSAIAATGCHHTKPGGHLPPLYGAVLTAAFTCRACPDTALAMSPRTQESVTRDRQSRARSAPAGDANVRRPSIESQKTKRFSDLNALARRDDAGLSASMIARPRGPDSHLSSLPFPSTAGNLPAAGGMPALSDPLSDSITFAPLDPPRHREIDHPHRSAPAGAAVGHHHTTQGGHHSPLYGAVHCACTWRACPDRLWRWFRKPETCRPWPPEPRQVCARR